MNKVGEVGAKSIIPDYKWRQENQAFKVNHSRFSRPVGVTGDPVSKAGSGSGNRWGQPSRKKKSLHHTQEVPGYGAATCTKEHGSTLLFCGVGKHRAPPHCLFPFPFAHKGHCLCSTLHGGRSRQKCLQLRGCDHTKAAYLKVVCAGTARGHHPTDVDREQGGYPGEAISLQGTRNQVRDCIGLPFKISSSAVQR